MATAERKTADPALCPWCNGYRETLPMGMCRLHEHAPELLKALQAVVRVADRATVEFDAARSAIAKATGNA